MDKDPHQGVESSTPVPPRRKHRGRSLSVNRLATMGNSLDSEPNQFNMIHNNFGYDRGKSW